MKYWRGYLVAGIFALISMGLTEFAASHWELVDMIYPYLTRLVQNYLADWSSSIDFCLWQLLLILGGILLLASVVMMVIWKWNPIQWFGWVLAVVSIVSFWNTAVFGLNNYSGTLAQDVHLEITEYTLSELEEAGRFYRDQANDLADRLPAQSGSFEELAVQAANGFETLTYSQFRSVFAGSTAPVKKLGWEDLFAGRGITGITCGMTGEAAVNPQTPEGVLPYVICREMSKRMCITNEQDAAFAAFLASTANEAPEFQYAGYMMAYRYCYTAIASMETPAAQSAANRLTAGEDSRLKQDLQAYNESFAARRDDNYTSEEETGPDRSHVVDMLVSWHIQQYILPTLEEEKVVFDPLDESQVDLSGLPNVEAEVAG